MGVTWAIINLNFFVFLLWMFPQGHELMAANFLISWEGLLDGRLWTLLTSIFSHNLFFHLFINLYVFLGFGRVLETFLGKKRFLSFYLFAGLCGSLSHALVSAFFLNDPRLPALGASGAISGVIMLFSLLFPKEKLLILGLIPVPAFFASFLIVGLDLIGLFIQAQGSGPPIGYGAHLGGALAGLCYKLASFNGVESSPKRF